jgi:hypothetical protein
MEINLEEGYGDGTDEEQRHVSVFHGAVAEHQDIFGHQIVVLMSEHKKTKVLVDVCTIPVFNLVPPLLIFYFLKWVGCLCVFGEAYQRSLGICTSLFSSLLVTQKETESSLCVGPGVRDCGSVGRDKLLFCLWSKVNTCQVN